MMVISSRKLAATLLAVSMLATAGRAAAQANLCVSPAYGVPGTDGKPQPWWTDLDGDGDVDAADLDVDDPRWTGASGHSLGSVGASHSPLEVRTTWANEGGRDFVYVSWLINVDTIDLLTAKHFLYLGFIPPGSTEGFADPAARLVRFRFTGVPTGAPTYCGDEAACNPTTSPAIYQIFKRTIADPPDGPQSDTCGFADGDRAGPVFELVDSSESATPFTWLDTVRFKDEGTRWAIQFRIPVDPAAASLASGIREDTLIAYQAELELGTGDFAFHRWPRAEATSLRELGCRLGGPDRLVVDPDTTFRAVSLIGNATADPAPGDCGNRLRIDSGDIGIRPGAAGSALTSEYAVTGTNTVVARVHNTSGATIAAGSLGARFRIANWGAQIAVGGDWTNLPVEAPVANPTATTSNAADIASGADQDLALSWALTADQRCQYTYDMKVEGNAAAQAAWDASCATCSLGVGVSSTGAHANGTTACLPTRRQHQCMLVELSGGGVDFETRSTYRNMDFAPLSVFERKATIDTAGLPTVPGQTKHEIFLVAMPRNMPRAVQAQTYEQLIAEQAAALLAALQAPSTDHNPVDEDPRFTGLRRPALLRPLPRDLDLPQIDEAILRRYPRNVRPLAGELARLALLKERRSGARSADLVQALANSFDATTLGRLVPTLDVYAYYKASPRGSALVPMTAFSLVTSHDGPVEGLIWALDGVTRVGGNVYKLTIPVGGSQKVGVRVQALEPGERPIIEQGPCGGCCRPACESSIASQLGNAPIALAIMFLAAGSLRRRRRRAKV